MSIQFTYHREYIGGARQYRIAPSCQQNPNFFKPNMRMGMKQRQEAAMQRRREEKQKEWTNWEQQMDEEERMRREQASQEFQQKRQLGTPNRFMERYQEAYQSTELAQGQKEQYLDDIRAQIQQRARERQRRSDRWISADITDKIGQKMLDETAKIQAREARRRQEQDAAMAAEYLRGKVRQKVAVFSDLVERMEENQSTRMDDVRVRRRRDVGESGSSGDRGGDRGGDRDRRRVQSSKAVEQDAFVDEKRRDDTRNSGDEYIDW